MFRSLLSKVLPDPRKKTRLRHVLQLGSLVERQGEAFYKRIAQEAKSADVKKICQELASDETRHLKSIENMLARWKSLPIDKDALDVMDVDGKMRGLFTSPPGPDAKKEEIIEYAMNQEKKMVEFYESFESEFADMWKKLKLESMIAEEKRHFIALRDMLKEPSTS